MIDNRQTALALTSALTDWPDTFIPGAANADALAWLRQPGGWPGLRLAIQGGYGVGKTHLLRHFACQSAAAFLPVAALAAFMPLPAAPCLAVDNADAIDDPRILLHVLNAAADRGMPTLLSGCVPPSEWRYDLADLTSRLRAMAVVTLHPPDDALLYAMLTRLLADNQLALSERLKIYLLQHLPRTGGALRDAVVRLNHLALASGGHVTRRLVVAVVGSAGRAAPADQQVAEDASGL